MVVGDVRMVKGIYYSKSDFKIFYSKLDSDRFNGGRRCQNDKTNIF